MSTQSAKPENQPHPARRALLTGGAVSLAAVAGTTLGLARPASAQTSPQDVTQIVPSGDTSGATDRISINNALNSGLFAWLAEGTFYIDQVITIPHKAALWGVGAKTRVMCQGNAGFFMHDQTAGDGSDRTANSSGCIRDLIIDGTNAGLSSIGLDIGDGWGYRLDHVFVENFTGPFAVGIFMNNQNYFTEKMEASNVHVRNCRTHVYLFQGSGDASFEYCDLAFYFAIQPGQDGFVIGGGAYMAGGSLMIRGNTYSQAASASQGYVIRVGTGTSGNGDGSTINSCRLDVAIEQNNFQAGDKYIPGTIFFTRSSNAMQNDYGMLAFRDTPWTLSNLALGQLTFRGILYGDSNLISKVEPPPQWV